MILPCPSSWLTTYVVPPYWVTTLAQVDALLKSVGFVVFVINRHHHCRSHHFVSSSSSSSRPFPSRVGRFPRPLVVFPPSRPSSSSSCVRWSFRRRRRRRCLGSRSSPSQRLRYTSQGSSVKIRSLLSGRRRRPVVDFVDDRTVRVRTPPSFIAVSRAPPPRTSAA